MTFSFFFLCFACTDAVSLSSTRATPTAVANEATGFAATGNKKLVSSDGSTSTVPGTANGKKWGVNYLKTKQKASNSWEASNLAKRNELKGTSKSDDKRFTLTSTQQGKAVLNSQSVKEDKKRQYTYGRTFNGDEAETSFQISPVRPKTSGKNEKHDEKHWAKVIGEQYHKDGIQSDAEIESDLNRDRNVSAWIMKGGRHSFTGDKDDINSETITSRELVRDSVGWVNPTNEDGDVQYVPPVLGTKYVTEIDRIMGTKFPNPQPQELAHAGRKLSSKWRKTPVDAADVVRAGAATQVISYKDYLKSRYGTDNAICPEGHFAGTDGCRLKCGARDTASTACTSQNADAEVVGWDAEDQANKCGAANKCEGAGNSCGTLSCGTCVCKMADGS